MEETAGELATLVQGANPEEPTETSKTKCARIGLQASLAAVSTWLVLSVLVHIADHAGAPHDGKSLDEHGSDKVVSQSFWQTLLVCLRSTRDFIVIVLADINTGFWTIFDVMFQFMWYTVWGLVIVFCVLIALVGITHKADAQGVKDATKDQDGIAGEQARDELEQGKQPVVSHELQPNQA